MIEHLNYGAAICSVVRNFVLEKLEQYLLYSLQLYQRYGQHHLWECKDRIMQTSLAKADLIESTSKREALLMKMNIVYVFASSRMNCFSIFELACLTMKTSYVTLDYS